MIKLSENIAFFRKEKGITQEQLATELHVSNQAVSKWESGKCYPDIELLPQIADYFGISVDDLLRQDAHLFEITCAKPADDLLQAAIKLAEERSELYTALLQRELQIGFTKATNIIREMTNLGYLIKSPLDSYKYLYFKSNNK